ncbi:hypothetical protein JKP88DRAFT_267535 [Tribonema minus]|uniref:Uncharacterized protein n=1 Tax=Tribonema minus TaxID=303371 RepID=A0A835Z7L6_9STRA|nr:hypothetical protein JKP88DRAFT_267535 [Tribonema minus]
MVAIKWAAGMCCSACMATTAMAGNSEHFGDISQRLPHSQGTDGSRRLQTAAPTAAPTATPSVAPTAFTSAPSSAPTAAPIRRHLDDAMDYFAEALPYFGLRQLDDVGTAATLAPSSAPTSAPSTAPTAAPSSAPTAAPIARRLDDEEEAYFSLEGRYLATLAPTAAPVLRRSMLGGDDYFED